MTHSHIPLLGPGVRVTLDSESCGPLTCRASRLDGGELHLTVTASGAEHSHALPAGVDVVLTMYCGGTCWECGATVREWLHGAPSVVVLGNLKGWRENQRRRERRAVRQHEALLLLSSGERAFGKSLDMSESGVSLLVPDAPGLMIGATGWLTLRISTSEWCKGIPVELIRRERWLQSGGRGIRLGAALGILTDEQYGDWESCLYPRWRKKEEKRWLVSGNARRRRRKSGPNDRRESRNPVGRCTTWSRPFGEPRPSWRGASRWRRASRCPSAWTFWRR